MKYIQPKINDNNDMNENDNVDVVQESKLEKINLSDNTKISTGIFKNTTDSNFYFFPNMLHILIHKNKFNMSHDEIIDFISDLEIKFLINGQTIFGVPIGFFTNLNGFIEEKNLILIPLDYKMFYQNIIFDANNFLQILIDNDSSKNGLDLRFIIDTEIINTVKKIKKINLFQYIQTHVIDNINNLTTHQQLNHNHLTKGFFIAGNIDLIAEINFTLNGQNRFIYDEILLNIICVRINDNFLYVPLDINEKYDDCDEASYTSSLNLSRINTVGFDIRFNHLPKKIIIYTLTGNFYKLYHNTPHLMYSI